MSAENRNLGQYWQEVQNLKDLQEPLEVTKALFDIARAEVSIERNERILWQFERTKNAEYSAQRQQYIEEHKKQILENVEEFVRREKSPLFPKTKKSFIFAVPEVIEDNSEYKVEWLEENWAIITYEEIIMPSIVITVTEEEYNSLKERVEAEQQRIVDETK